MRRTVLVSLLSLSLLTVAGCASPPQVSAMIVPVTDETRVPPDIPIRQSVSVRNVTGLRNGSLLEMQITDEDLRNALEISLEEHDVLAPMPDRLILDVELVEIQEQPIAVNLTVLGRFRYVLTGANGVTLLDTIVQAPFTPEITFDLFGPNNRRILAEGTVRRNIEEFLVQLRREARSQQQRFALAGGRS